MSMSEYAQINQEWKIIRSICCGYWLSKLVYQGFTNEKF